ncbi:MAG: type IV pilin protein [Acidobacteriota bacterium]
MKCSKQGQGSRRRGFTLIELMVTVVILAVLATVAMLSYQVYIRRARTAEASGLLANIGSAQEAYLAEFGQFCNVNLSQPAGDPDRDGLDWDPATVPAVWKQLGFVPDARRVSFAFNTQAGPPGGFANVADLGLTAAEYDGSNAWYVAWAIGDQDEDGAGLGIANPNNSVFWITHETTSVSSLRETE